MHARMPHHTYRDEYTAQERALCASWTAGRLRFELDPEVYMRQGRVDVTATDCDRP